MSNGSIGMCMAKLWKSEAAAIFLSKTYELPWDNCPVYGISQKMGFKIFRYSKNQLEAVEPFIGLQVADRDFDILMVHFSREVELREWFVSNFN